MRLGHGGFGDRDLMRVIGGAADQVLLGVEIGEARLRVKREQAFYFGHDLRADPVAGEKKELVIGHEKTPP